MNNTNNSDKIKHTPSNIFIIQGGTFKFIGVNFSIRR